MKEIVATGILVLAGTWTSQASLAQWTFETSQPGTSGSFAAETGDNANISLASGYHAGTTTYSAPPGDRSTYSFNSTDWSIGDYYQFTTSTIGYNDINVTFEAASSGTGPQNFELAYSINGTTFTDFATYSVEVNSSPNTPWNHSMSAASAAVYDLSFDLSAITALDNQSIIYLRLIDSSTTSANGGTVANGGSSRVDDFTILGDAEVSPVPEPSNLMAGALMCLTFGMRGVRYLRNCKRVS